MPAWIGSRHGVLLGLKEFLSAQRRGTGHGTKSAASFLVPCAHRHWSGASSDIRQFSGNLLTDFSMVGTLLIGRLAIEGH
jgi:hypothetical protein